MILTKSLKHPCLNTKNMFSFWHGKENIIEVDKRMKTTDTTACTATADSRLVQLYILGSKAGTCKCTCIKHAQYCILTAAC